MPLLDTDIMIDVLRGYVPAVEWIYSLDNDPITLSGFVVMELYQGCQNKTEQDKVERVLKTCHLRASMYGRNNHVCRASPEQWHRRSRYIDWSNQY